MAIDIQSDTLAIVRVQPVGPGRHARTDLIAGVPKELLITLVTPKLVGREIPIPNGVAGRTGNQLKSFLADPESFFRAFSLDRQCDLVGDRRQQIDILL